MLRNIINNGFHPLVLLLLCLWGTVALSTEIDIGELQQRIDNAQPGASIRISAGLYHGNLIINKPLVLQGEDGAIIDGVGLGDVIRVRAPDVKISGLVIQHSGTDLTDMNAGIFVERQAERVSIENNVIENNTFGIWLDGCPQPQVLANRVHGNPSIRSQDRGNGIHLSSVTKGLIADNEVWETRDGIYIESSHHNRLADNYLHDLRYGIHYMYSYSNEVVNNLTRNTRTGYALMQSRFLTVTGNRSESDANYGILLNFIVSSTIANNTVLNTRKGRAFVTGGADIVGAEGKALFIYNAQFNNIHDNQFEAADIGIHLTAGSEDNKIYNNAFIGNQVQVKYVASRQQEWSLNSRGNYWSDYLGWDLDANGIGDKTYEPNDAVDKLLWKYPIARLLMSSPAIETLRWVQQQFPVFKPQGVRDSYPLMLPPHKESIL